MIYLPLHKDDLDWLCQTASRIAPLFDVHKTLDDEELPPAGNKYKLMMQFFKKSRFLGLLYLAFVF